MRLSSIHDGDLETSYDADAACEGKVDVDAKLLPLAWYTDRTK